MSNPTHWPSRPMLKGRPGQIAYVRVRLLYTPNQDNTLAVTPVDAMGQGVAAQGSEIWVDASAVMTAREAAEAAKKGGVK